MLSYTVFKNTTTIQVNIKLLDTNFANKWKDYLIRTIKRLPNLAWKPGHNPIVNNGTIHPLNNFKKLKESFMLLQKHYGTDYSFEINELDNLIQNPKELTQSHLNLWNRHFTTNAMEFVMNQETNHLIPQTDTSDDVIFATIHMLNQCTQELESITSIKHQNSTRIAPLKNKAFYSVRSADAINLDDSASLWGDDMTESPGEDFTFNNEYHHTVWMADDIQGKDHFKCWRNEDDASNDDVHGNEFMTPNIMLDPDMIYATIMDNPEFKQFVIDSKKPINRYPIGNIVDVDSINWDVFKKGKLISIVLDGETLWESS